MLNLSKYTVECYEIKLGNNFSKDYFSSPGFKPRWTKTILQAFNNIGCNSNYNISSEFLNLDQTWHNQNNSVFLSLENENEDFDYIIPMDGEGEDRPGEIKILNISNDSKKMMIAEKGKIVDKIFKSIESILSFRLIDSIIFAPIQFISSLHL